MGDEPARDIVDEVLYYLRSVLLFRTYDVQGAGDKTLIYLTLFASQCLKRLSSSAAIKAQRWHIGWCQGMMASASGPPVSSQAAHPSATCSRTYPPVASCCWRMRQGALGSWKSTA